MKHQENSDLRAVFDGTWEDETKVSGAAHTRPH